MNVEELEKKVKKFLPKGWTFHHAFEWEDDDKYEGGFVVDCPIEEFLGNSNGFHEKTRKIAEATNSVYDGGGWAVGGINYNNYFYVKLIKTDKKREKVQIMSSF